jgi:hypothetical protein
MAIYRDTLTEAIEKVRKVIEAAKKTKEELEKEREEERKKATTPPPSPQVTKS